MTISGKPSASDAIAGQASARRLLSDELRLLAERFASLESDLWALEKS